MDEIDLTTAIGRVLTSRALRERFRDAPPKLARHLNLRDADVAAFVQLDANELDRQADALIAKRFHEIAKLLPEIIDDLGSEAEQLFRYYANANWPTGHRRHAVDAHDFLRFLKRNRIRGINNQTIRRLRRIAMGT